jgi:hypothetical protein
MTSSGFFRAALVRSLGLELDVELDLERRVISKRTHSTTSSQ